MDGKKKPPRSLNELLDRIDDVAGEHEDVSVKQVMDAVGRRSFEPLFLVVGVVVVACTVMELILPMTEVVPLSTTLLSLALVA